MFGSQVLDVGIGLVLVFLLVSVIMTAAQEGIEAILQTRAAFLQRAIGELMQGDTSSLDALYDHPLIFALYRGDPALPKPSNVGERLKRWWSGQAFRAPAYIPREVFSAALIDMVQTGEPLPDRLRNAYEGLERITGGDAGRLRREIEGWYDGTMDRASGWFKKRAQRNLFFLGLVLAVALNINAVSIAQYLTANDAQRALVVGAAQGVIEQAQDGDAPVEGQRPIGPLSNEQAKALHKQLAQIGLPIGWSAASQRWMAPRDAGEGPVTRWLLILAGWLITALATMLGAPFWFDVLNRLMVIRSTVKPKEKSLDEPSADGGSAKRPATTTVVAGQGGGGTSAPPAGPERDRAAIAGAEPIYG